MKIYFTIHNTEEMDHLKLELKNGGFTYTAITRLPNGDIEVKTPCIEGNDIEYLSQCYQIEKITD